MTRMHDEDENPKEEKQEQPTGGMLNKKMEQMFLKNALFIFGDQ